MLKSTLDCAIKSILLIGMTIVSLTACGSTTPTAISTIGPGGNSVDFTLVSSAFSMGDLIPKDFTCTGSNRSPRLSWSGAPSITQSFVLIMDDPDAPGGTFTHWILYDIPAASAQLVEAESTIGLSGTNSSGQSSFQGPCPPIGRGAHRYFFTLYALNISSLQLKSGATRRQVEAAIESHVVGQAQLMGKYERPAP
jgi:Raf kinase inhibitor-like YbhB/YbcL family protein